MKISDFSLPFCIIPERILENYEERVKKFYSRGGKIRIERYKKSLEDNFNLNIKSLIWDYLKGLTNITLSASIGLDLDNGRYVFHNLEDINLPEAKIMFKIAKKYLELLKIN
ncbi:hypothetical protein A3K82_02575 [Candidatus Pacearchaeota archaeon RBG_19FT_COMBO_34_9]|nr:MAG: hypothetical protein A3K82_02575 [Candidatus Pacearchaeota archaeon RBG_19FT_COMBO_34_9]OGJ15910.1 MAG: hypothetical protein A3K74_02315 [Candidatus Pacearchaeota archaeon RBG_13_33_26]